MIEGSLSTGKTKRFAALAIFYHQCGIQVLMTGPTDMPAYVIVEQFSEFINSSPTLNLKIPLRVYQPENKEYGLYRSESALALGSEKTQQSSEVELVLLELLLSVYANQRQQLFRLKDLSL